MPTGYTAKIKDGISFEQFALSCARAFGACVTLRDNPMDEGIPERFWASKYHAEAIEKCRHELAALALMSDSDCESAAQLSYDAKVKDQTEYINGKIVQRATYEAMLAQVENWTPPTPDHVGLRDFMLQQIRETIRFDCSGDYNKPAIVLETGQEWADKRLWELTRDLEYHKTEYAKEVARAREATEWVRALRGSLK